MNDEKNKGAAFFPYVMPRERPDLPLSRAMDRLFANYSAPSTWWNELYSQFRYTELEGLDYRGGDGRLTRRDPSKVIKADGKYYVWYTRRSTDAPPQGPGRGAESIPSTDWDLSEIWYATSQPPPADQVACPYHTPRCLTHLLEAMQHIRARALFVAAHCVARLQGS